MPIGRGVRADTYNKWMERREYEAKLCIGQSGNSEQTKIGKNVPYLYIGANRTTYCRVLLMNNCCQIKNYCRRKVVVVVVLSAFRAQCSCFLSLSLSLVVSFGAAGRKNSANLFGRFSFFFFWVGNRRRPTTILEFATIFVLRPFQIAWQSQIK